MQSHLATLGISPPEEKLYRALLRMRRADPDAIAAELETDARTIRSALESLEKKGMATLSAGEENSFAAVPPDVAFNALIHRRAAEVDDVRRRLSALVEEFRSDVAPAIDPSGVVEVAAGDEALRQRDAQLQLSAQHEVRCFYRGPFPGPARMNEIELDALGRGIRYRVLYDRDALLRAGQPEHLLRHVAAGEEARVGTHLPIKLAIADNDLALVPLTVDDAGARGALLVRGSPLLDGLIGLWEKLWSEGAPVSQALAEGKPQIDKEPPTETDKNILALMAAGLQDDAIAAQLDHNVRTIRRRISRLMDQLDADTRFQAGLQAARRGWL